MKSKSKLYRSANYWVEKTQNELYQHLYEYMKEKGLNQTELAKELGFSKGYISQVLNGRFNHNYRKLAELSLAIGLTPHVMYQNIDDYTNDMETNSECLIYELKPQTFSGTGTLSTNTYPEAV